MSIPTTDLITAVNHHLDSEIDDAIDRYLDAWRDLDAFRQAPHLLFNHRTIGKYMRDICVRKKRERKFAEDRLRLLGVKKTKVNEFEHFDMDLFRVESTQPVSNRAYHHTASMVIAPAFEWQDQYEEPRVRHGSVIAFVYDPELAEQLREEVACG